MFAQRVGLCELEEEGLGVGAGRVRHAPNDIGVESDAFGKMRRARAGALGRWAP
jgi:hypothetical protein